MLSLHLRVRGDRQIQRALTSADEEECAQPETPIPVIVARDEELGLSDTSSDRDSVRPIAHPPPAYGLWRSSVVSLERSFVRRTRMLIPFSGRIPTCYTGNEQPGNAMEKLRIWLSILLYVRPATTPGSMKPLPVYIPHLLWPCLSL